MKIIIRVKRPQTDQKAKDDDENKKKRKKKWRTIIFYIPTVNTNWSRLWWTWSNSHYARSSSPSHYNPTCRPAAWPRPYSLVSRWQFWHVHIALLLYRRTCRHGCGIILHRPERKVPPDWNGADSLRYSHDFFCCWCSLNCERVLQRNLLSLQQCWIVYLHWDRGPLSAQLLCYLPPRSLFELEHPTVLSLFLQQRRAARRAGLTLCACFQRNVTPKIWLTVAYYRVRVWVVVW